MKIELRKIALTPALTTFVMGIDGGEYSRLEAEAGRITPENIDKHHAWLVEKGLVLPDNFYQGAAI